MIKYKISKKKILRYLNKHLIAISIIISIIFHLSLLWQWSPENIVPTKLSLPTNLIHLTELRIGKPAIAQKIKELKIDEKKIKINAKDKAPKKTKKSNPTLTGENFFPASAADKQPRPLIDIRSIMSYPEQARKMNIQATVIVEINISSTGKVVKAKIIQAAGWGFDEEVLRKIKMVQFKPAMKDDLPIAVTVQIPLEFVLN